MRTTFALRRSLCFNLSKF